MFMNEFSHLFRENGKPPKVRQFSGALKRLGDEEIYLQANVYR